MNEPAPTPMTELQTSVLSFLAHGCPKGMPLDEISEAFGDGKHRGDVHRALQALKRRDFITRYANGKSALWKYNRPHVEPEPEPKPEPEPEEDVPVPEGYEGDFGPYGVVFTGIRS